MAPRLRTVPTRAIGKDLSFLPNLYIYPIMKPISEEAQHVVYSSSVHVADTVTASTCRTLDLDGCALTHMYPTPNVALRQGKSLSATGSSLPSRLIRFCKYGITQSNFINTDLSRTIDSGLCPFRGILIVLLVTMGRKAGNWASRYLRDLPDIKQATSVALQVMTTHRMEAMPQAMNSQPATQGEPDCLIRLDQISLCRQYCFPLSFESRSLIGRRIVLAVCCITTRKRHKAVRGTKVLKYHHGGLAFFVTYSEFNSFLMENRQLRPSQNGGSSRYIGPGLVHIAGH